MSRLEKTLSKIDAILAQDPSFIEVDGEKRPLAPYHAERRTYWVNQLVENPSEALRIAARAQHLRRWEIPRNSYPDGRIGYLKWRTDLKQFHAEKTAELMRETGYDDITIARVQKIISKQGIKQDDDVQTIEDALCLVFLETQLGDVAQQESDKIISILQKTWQKMSPEGRSFALQLPMSDTNRALVERALADLER